MNKSIIPVLALIILPFSAQVLSQVWTTEVDLDEMTGEVSAYAFSPPVSSTTPMMFPYASLKSQMVFACDPDSIWTYLWFGHPPNLSDGETKSGYNLVKTIIKWDDEIYNVRLSQKWGAKTLFFLDDTSFTVSKMEDHAKAMVRLNWHNHGKVFFEYSLSGSSAAIEKARGACNE